LQGISRRPNRRASADPQKVIHKGRASASRECPDQQPLLDPGLERIELRGAGNSPVVRRIVARERAADRGAVKPVRRMDLADRAPLHPMHPPDLGPLPHADHLLLLASASRTDRGSGPSRTLRPHAEGGSVFNPRRWTSIHAAPTPRSPCCWGDDCPGVARTRRGIATGTSRGLLPLGPRNVARDSIPLRDRRPRPNRAGPPISFPKPAAAAPKHGR
jgi:hypothetical protein